MADLLDLSARIIDSGITDQPTNRITQELSEVADGVAVIESFSHAVTFTTDEGLVTFDSSGVATGAAVVESLRRWSTDPVHTLVYTHGHLDHVGGSGAFVADAEQRGHRRPTVVGHEAIPARFERYRRTDGYNLHINARQFGWLTDKAFSIGGDAGAAGELDATAGGSGGRPVHFLPDDVAEPDVTYRSGLTRTVGGLELELHHARGETDDHTWAWVPRHRAICSGDFLIWNFPNAGNPQKVQRYPDEWAVALRAMVAKEPELLLPAHGLPIAGRERITAVLTAVAEALERLVDETVALMNQGATLDEIVHTVRVPDETLAKPFLRPAYDEPEFVVRNVWRRYGGWYDGNPARLKPPADARLAAEVAELAGGAAALVDQAQALADAGELRLACQLVEWAAAAEPGDRAVQRARADVYQRRARAEGSLMSIGIFTAASRDSRRAAE